MELCGNMPYARMTVVQNQKQNFLKSLEIKEADLDKKKVTTNIKVFEQENEKDER